MLVLSLLLRILRSQLYSEGIEHFSERAKMKVGTPHERVDPNTDVANHSNCHLSTSLMIYHHPAPNSFGLQRHTRSYTVINLDSTSSSAN